MSEYIIIAGPNGSGKSTLYNISGEYADIEYMNMDSLVRSITTGDELHDYIHATGIIMQKIDDCFKKNKSFVQESTLTGKTIQSNIQRAKDADYKITIHFIGLDSETIAKKRIKHRAATGGHDIPAKDIERRYKLSFEKIKELIPIADEIFFYDNSDRFIKVAKYVNGKCIWENRELPRWYLKLNS